MKFINEWNKQQQQQQAQVFNYTNKQAQNNIKNAKAAHICGDALLEKAEQTQEVNENEHKAYCRGAVGRHEEVIEKTMKAALEALGLGKKTYSNNDKKEGKCGDNLELRRSHNISQINKVLMENGVQLISHKEARKVDHMLTKEQLTNTAVDNNAELDITYKHAKEMKELSNKVANNYIERTTREDKRRTENAILRNKKEKTKNAFKNVEPPKWLKF